MNRTDIRPRRKPRGHGKTNRLRKLRQQVAWNLARLESDTVGTSTIERSHCILLLHLDRVSRDVDPTGDHAMQQIVSMAGIPSPKRMAGRRVFGRDDLLAGLRRFMDMEVA